LFRYTSSRTSLEPSECEDTASGSIPTHPSEGSNEAQRSDDQHPPSSTEFSNAAINVENSLNSTHRVSIISHQLEENYGNAPITKKKPPQRPPQTMNEHDTVITL
uniref:CD44 antigen n=1 Tax=Ascaris lumbricoides TaxID=6252 RepID=A0A0M3HJW3_ASCLU